MVEWLGGNAIVRLGMNELLSNCFEAVVVLCCSSHGWKLEGLC